ncbi:hypothetical protein DPMN_134457 [Dreissena polymorpha]|uniref:Uncharacterized protein n=1 Tax=Dreissena polymorpha TaxID=45954 RepID=A0A9D4FX89_DREPO|nr:hypothetical protein DPMN_134457 [Dreissena polymorpha]
MIRAEPLCVIRDEPGLYRDEPGKTGAPPGKYKMFNTSGMNRESPGRTGKNRRGTETTGTAPGTTATAP